MSILVFLEIKTKSESFGKLNIYLITELNFGQLKMGILKCHIQSS